MIGIIGAMSVEVEGIRARIERPESREIGGREFVSGQIGGRDVVVVQCGIGKVNAALCAQIMIQVYRPQIIVNSGVGGSLADELGYGDIAIARNLVQHDVDTSPLGDPVGLVSTVNQIYFDCDERAISLIKDIVTDMDGVACATGTVASGDQFISSGERKRWIVEHFHAIACEMEGGAIAQVCTVNHVKCAVIRAISDNADDESHMDYNQFLKTAAQRSVEVLMRFVAAW